MIQLRPIWLLIIVLAAASVGYVATLAMAAGGYSSPGLPMSSVVTLSAVGILVLSLGVVIWRDQRRIRENDQRRRQQGHVPGEPRSPKGPSRAARRLSPLQAVRVVVAAQACAYAGALIAGWHGGVVLHLAPTAGMNTPNVVSALVVMIGGLLWVIIGFTVETLCRLPPDHDETVQDGNFDHDDGTEPYAAF